MSKTIGPFRHTGTLGTLSGGTFTPSRGTRDAVRPIKGKALRGRKTHLDDAALSRAIKAGVAQGMASHLAKLKSLTRDAAAVPANRTADSLDDFRGRLSAAVDTYRFRRARA